MSHAVAHLEQSMTASLPVDSDPPLLLLLSELSPAKVELLPQDLISTFVQTSCPRLSIDWGYAFDRPLLSPYEASVAVGRVHGWSGLEIAGREKGSGDYPMDFYSVSVEKYWSSKHAQGCSQDTSLGDWTPRHRAIKAV